MCKAWCPRSYFKLFCLKSSGFILAFSLLISPSNASQINKEDKNDDCTSAEHHQSKVSYHSASYGAELSSQDQESECSFETRIIPYSYGDFDPLPKELLNIIMSIRVAKDKYFYLYRLSDIPCSLKMLLVNHSFYKYISCYKYNSGNITLEFYQKSNPLKITYKRSDYNNPSTITHPDTIEFCAFTYDCIDMPSEHWKHIERSSIEILKFTSKSCNFPQKDIGSLMINLSKSQVSTLIIMGIELEENTVEALIKGLENTLLKTLILIGTNIGDEGARQLTQIIPKTEISHLKVADNHIGDEGALAFAEMLRTKNTRLETLDFYDNLITGDAALKLIQVLSSRETLIKTLNLSSNRLSGDLYIDIIQASHRSKFKIGR